MEIWEARCFCRINQEGSDKLLLELVLDMLGFGGKSDFRAGKGNYLN